MTRSTMSNREKVLALLAGRGWAARSVGRRGEMWAPVDLDLAERGAAIGVPDEDHWDTFGMTSVVERIAFWEGIDVQEVRETVDHWEMDITRLRAANDYVIADSIPLEAGAVLLHSARLMFRSAATAAVLGPKQVIQGNYSKIGDQLAEGVRMGHTEKGSYIVPILVPVGGPQEREDEGQDQFENLAVPEVESPARRMTRTFAEAFATMHDKIVRSDQIPGTEGILEMVAAGVTTEFVNAVADVLSEEAVSTLDAQFRWANSQEKPAAEIGRVNVPAEAVDAFRTTARKMRTAKIPTAELNVGPVVRLEATPDGPLMEFAIQAMRRGRPAKVRVIVPATHRDEVARWFVERRTVTVYGTVERQSGGLIVRRPQSFGVADLDFTDSEQE